MCETQSVTEENQRQSSLHVASAPTQSHLEGTAHPAIPDRPVTLSECLSGSIFQLRGKENIIDENAKLHTVLGRNRARENTLITGSESLPLSLPFS